LIRRPSRLIGAPYTARERLSAAPSWLRWRAKKSLHANIPSSEPARLATSRVSQTAGRPLQPRRAGVKIILDEKAKAVDATIVHNTPPGQIAPALPNCRERLCDFPELVMATPVTAYNRTPFPCTLFYYLQGRIINTYGRSFQTHPKLPGSGVQTTY
jgi:hypothetical protein